MNLNKRNDYRKEGPDGLLSLVETNKLREQLGLKPIPVSGIERKKKEKDENTGIDIAPAAKDVRNESNDEKVDATHSLKRVEEDAENSQDAFEEIKASEDINSWLSRLEKPRKTTTDVSSPVDLREKQSELEGVEIGHSRSEVAKLRDNEILTLDDSNVILEEDSKLKNERLSNDQALEAKNEQVKALFNKGQSAVTISMSPELDEDNASKIRISGSTISISNLQDESDVENNSKHGRKLGDLGLFLDDALDTKTLKSSNNKPKSKKIKKVKKRQLANQRRTRDTGEESNIGQRVATVVDLDQTDSYDLESEAREMNTIMNKKRRKLNENRKHMSPEAIAQEIMLNKKLDNEEELEAARILANSNLSASLSYDQTDGFLEAIGSRMLLDDKSGRRVSNDTSSLENTTNVKSENSLSKGTILKEDRVSARNSTSNDYNSPSFSSGLASTLKFLRSRNVVSKPSQNNSEKFKRERDVKRSISLFKLNLSIEERILRDELMNDKKYINMSRDQREILFQQYLEARLQEKGISLPKQVNSEKNVSSYNPNVSLTYRDDSGNKLNPKEAFKHLSHKFHGNESGKAKIEKKLSKSLELKRKNSESSEHVI